MPHLLWHRLAPTERAMPGVGAFRTIDGDVIRPHHADIRGARPGAVPFHLPGLRHAAGPGPAQTGRPTTKRAPSGSEVTSASVGRMFSAQMTPP